MPKDTKANLSPAAEIASYVKARILTGVYRVGQKLPTADEIAKQFSVDPNTARAAYARLTRAGLVRSMRGKGTFVTADVGMGDARRLRSLVDDAISEGRRLGLSPEELATILWVHERFAADRPRLWYIDNWHPYFDAVAGQIEEATDESVHTLRLDELDDEVARGLGPSDGDIVTTTKFGLEPVKSGLAGTDVHYVAVAPELTRETLTRLAELPVTGRLGVICIEPIFAAISGKVIARSGISLDQVRGNTSDVTTLPPVFEQADAIAISTVALARLKSAQLRLPDKPIIPFAYALGSDSLGAVTTTMKQRTEAATAAH